MSSSDAFRARATEYFFLFAAIMLVALSFLGLRSPLSSMSLYTAALMALNQAAPALICAAIPTRQWQQLNAFRSITDWLFDPWVAGAAFLLSSTAISFPSILDTSVANALYAAPIGCIEFCSGVLVWIQIYKQPTSFTSTVHQAVFALAVGIPMTIVAVVWITSSTVLYTPYLDIICLWNFSPLEDQRWSGFVMLLSGLPLQLVGTWRLVNA